MHDSAASALCVYPLWILRSQHIWTCGCSVNMQTLFSGSIWYDTYDVLLRKNSGGIFNKGCSLKVFKNVALLLYKKKYSLTQNFVRIECDNYSSNPVIKIVMPLWTALRYTDRSIKWVHNNRSVIPIRSCIIVSKSCNTVLLFAAFIKYQGSYAAQGQTRRPR